MFISTTYTFEVELPTGATVERSIQLEADCIQDSSALFSSEVCLVWSDETMRRMRDHLVCDDQFEGCVEVMTEAFFVAEQAACRRAIARQQAGREVSAA